MTPVPLSETQNGLVPEKEMPQAFTSDGSVIFAELTAWSSVTRFVTEKLSARVVPFHPASDQQAEQESTYPWCTDCRSIFHLRCLLDASVLG